MGSNGFDYKLSIDLGLAAFPIHPDEHPQRIHAPGPSQSFDYVIFMITGFWGIFSRLIISKPILSRRNSSRLRRFIQVALRSTFETI